MSTDASKQEPWEWQVRITGSLLDRVSEVKPAAFAIYLRLLYHADKHGQCWPAGETMAVKSGMNIKTVQRAIKRLESEGWITTDRTGHDENGHRRNVYTITPQEPGDKNGTRTGGPGTKNVARPGDKLSQSLATKTVQEQTPIEPTPKEQEQPRSKSQYTSDFEAWWKVYPRRVGKRKAFAAWKVALKNVEGNGEAPETLLEITRRYAASPAGNAGEFTPHPATWLNQGRYEDDPAEWQDKTASKPSKPLEYRDDNL